MKSIYDLFFKWIYKVEDADNDYDDESDCDDNCIRVHVRLCVCVCVYVHLYTCKYVCMYVFIPIIRTTNQNKKKAWAKYVFFFLNQFTKT